VVGAPGWVASDRFDVEAIAAASSSAADRQRMLLAMLRDRFHLAGRLEPRDRPVFNLVRVTSDARARDKLRVSDGSCAALRAPGAPAPTPEQVRPCMLAFFPGSLHVNGVTATQFATAGLTRVVGRPVIDRTGLGDTLYDWSLDWTPDPSSAPNATAADNLPTSVFSAVQEQLGLRLESATALIDVVVVDRVEKPTPD
jgi:uncharacterized protein (TIGR03435 family)